MENRTKKRTGHDGSSFDSFLNEQGIRKEVEAVAVERVLAWKLARKRKRRVRVRASALAMPSQAQKKNAPERRNCH